MPAGILRFRVPAVRLFPVKSTRHVGVTSGGLHQPNSPSARNRTPNEACDTARKKTAEATPSKVHGPSKVHNPNPSNSKPRHRIMGWANACGRSPSPCPDAAVGRRNLTRASDSLNRYRRADPVRPEGNHQNLVRHACRSPEQRLDRSLLSLPPFRHLSATNIVFVHEP
jgi:hypothetical protein